MGLDEVRSRGRGHEPGDRRPISFMLPRRFLGRPARRLFRGRLLRVGIPTAYGVRRGGVHLHGAQVDSHLVYARVSDRRRSKAISRLERSREIALPA